MRNNKRNLKTLLQATTPPVQGPVPPSATTTSTTTPTTTTTVITNPDGSITRTALDGTKTTTYPDGRIVIVDPNGKVTEKKPVNVVSNPDGSKTITYADGTIVTNNADGTITTTNPDGMTITTDANGNVITPAYGAVPATPSQSPSLPPGYVHPGDKVVQNPDGTVTVISVYNNSQPPGEIRVTYYHVGYAYMKKQDYNCSKYGDYCQNEVNRCPGAYPPIHCAVVGEDVVWTTDPPRPTLPTNGNPPPGTNDNPQPVGNGNPSQQPPRNVRILLT